MNAKNIYERVYELRKSLNIKQGDFAKSLGLTNAAVSMIEKGKNPLTETNLRLICLTYGINEDWLRTGEGEMFDPVNNDPLIKEVVELMQKMDESDRIVVLNYVRWYVSQQQTLRGKSPDAAKDADPGFPLEPRRRVENFEEKKAIG
jgi:transcriptional regulator with XRE-family HTH domain